jgi:hypothetical protein
MISLLVCDRIGTYTVHIKRKESAIGVQDVRSTEDTACEKPINEKVDRGYKCKNPAVWGR